MVAMALLLLVLFHKSLISGEMLVAGDMFHVTMPWSSEAGNEPIYPADSILLTLPWTSLVTEALDYGDLPLWDTQSLAGHPLLANSQSRVLDPFNALFQVFHFPTAYNLRIILELYSAGVFMYLYLRRALQLERLAALMGGTLYMLSGVLLAWLEWQWFVGAALWLPLVLLFVDRAITTRRRRYSALAGIALAGSILAGTLQMLLAMVFATVGYATVISIVHAPKAARTLEVRRGLGLAAQACLIAAGLAAVQLVPTLELFANAQREYGLMENLGPWLRMAPRSAALSVGLLPGFIHPYWPGTLNSLDFRNLLEWPTFRGNIVEYQGYMGILAIVLAGVALRWSRGPRVRAQLYLALATLVACFLTPLNLWLYNRALFIYAFAVAVLAAVGMNHLLSVLRKKRPFPLVDVIVGKVLAGVVVLGVCVFLVLVRWQDPIRRLAIEYARGRQEQDPVLRPTFEVAFERVWRLYENFLPTSPSVYLPILALTAIAIVFFFARRARLAATWFGLGCITIASAELIFFGLTFNPTTPPQSVYPPTPETQFLREHGGLSRILALERAGQDPYVLPPNMHLPYGLQSVEGGDPLFPKHYGRLVRLIEHGSSGGADRLAGGAHITRAESRLLDMLGVKYIITAPGATPRDPKLRRVLAGSVDIYENPRALPRAFVVPRIEVISNPKALEDRLTSREFDPRAEVLLDAHPSGFRAPTSSADNFAAEVIQYRQERVVVRVPPPGGGILVLTDTHFPGWRAAVNGREAKIHRANLALRAVVLEEGENTVKFVYEPWSFRVGVLISIASAAILLLSSAIISVHRRRRAVEAPPAAAEGA